MNVLVTAGNTMALIDRVRCITNIFTGRTGASIARTAYERGHAVTLITSHPDTLADLATNERCRMMNYRTFEELQDRMAEQITSGRFDSVIHSAAVSDYLSAGVYATEPGTRFDESTGAWLGESPALLNKGAGKVKSDQEELWIRLKRAPKLIDRVRGEWGFRGVLVKFKLEVGLSDDELLSIAESSRGQSDADLMAANTLEGSATYAFLGPIAGRYERVERSELASRLIAEVERLSLQG